MIRNAEYVMSLIEDPSKRAKKAQVGVDLTLASVNRIAIKSHEDIWSKKSVGYVYNDESGHKASFGYYEPVDPEKIDGLTVFYLPPGAYSITFEQGLKPLPGNNTAFIYHRSTLARNGALIRSAVYDPGFTTPQMGAILEVWRPIIIEQHARVAQILYNENEDVAALYNGSYQGEKDKK